MSDHKPEHANSAADAQFLLNVGLEWECGEDNDGWYVGPPGEQRAWAASEQDALMIVFCMNASIEIRRRAIEEAITAIEESQPPETTPWSCVDAIRKKCKVSNDLGKRDAVFGGSA